MRRLRTLGDHTPDVLRWRAPYAFWWCYLGLRSDIRGPDALPRSDHRGCQVVGPGGCPKDGQTLADNLPRRIFVSDMSDSLSAAVPFEYLLEEIVKPASDGPGRRHDWPWLTKRPREMAKFASWLTERGIQWPDNLWAGTSVTSIQSTNRISNLLLVGSATTTRFVSVEPQVEPLDLRPWLSELNWVIHGGESGRAARLFDVALGATANRAMCRPWRSFLLEAARLQRSRGRHSPPLRGRARWRLG